MPHREFMYTIHGLNRFVILALCTYGKHKVKKDSRRYTRYIIMRCREDRRHGCAV